MVYIIAKDNDTTCKIGSISVRLTNKAKTFNIYNFKSFIFFYLYFGPTNQVTRE